MCIDIDIITMTDLVIGGQVSTGYFINKSLIFSLHFDK